MREFVLVTVFLALAGAAGADSLKLKNGDTVAGTVVSENEDEVVVNVRGIDLTYYQEDIESIERGGPEAPAVAAETDTDMGMAEDFGGGEETDGDMMAEEAAPDEAMVEAIPEAMPAVEESLDGGVMADSAAADDYDPSRESITVTVEPAGGSEERPVIEYEAVESSPEELEALKTAYQDYTRAMAQMMTLEDIRPYIVKANADEMERMMEGAGPEGLMALQMMKALSPPDPEIESVEIRDNKGIIMVKGTGMLGESRGREEFVKEDGRWKLDHSSWKSGNNLDSSEEKFAPIGEIPAEQARGTIKGQDFVAQSVNYEKAVSVLELRQGEDFFPDLAVKIFLFKQDEAVENTVMKVPSEDSMLNPHVHVQWKEAGKDMPETEIETDGYQMQLEFASAVDGKIPGKIYLDLPEHEVKIQGTFEAGVK